MMINLEWLVGKGWLPELESASEGADAFAFRSSALRNSYHAFLCEPEQSFIKRKFRSFCSENSYWLDDFAIYIALRVNFGNTSWQTWPREFRDRDKQALLIALNELADEVGQVKFEQFVFFSQWEELRAHAQRRGVQLFGDMPIFVAADSAEVWAERDNFDLDGEGNARVVAGVPPDYFSATGQRWGNPHYDWIRMANTGFEWWIARFKTQLALYDLIRIDHFRGFEAYWEILASEPTAMNGQWIKAPGQALLARVFECFGGHSLPLVAENLGIITDEVEALRNRFGIPGMLILHFAFDGGSDNPYLPQNHDENSVVYTGTHDNDTTLGWYSGLSESQKAGVLDYLNETDKELPMPWALVSCAFNSKARLAVVPMQDFLGLGGDARMNTPGTLDSSNWAWRFSWSQITDGLSQRISQLSAKSQRCG